MRPLRAKPSQDLDALIERADQLIRRPGEDRDGVREGLVVCHKALRLLGKEGDERRWAKLRLLEGIGLNQLGECARAIDVLDQLLLAAPHDPEARLERAIAQFELGRFAEAKRGLEEVLDHEPNQAWAHHYLGLLCERGGEDGLAKRHFRRAQALWPEEFPPPVRLGEGEFERAVEAALHSLPAKVKPYLENVTVAIEPYPSDEDLAHGDPPLSPCILGVFRGTPLPERSVQSGWDAQTCAIVLYQRNLERFARTEQELVEQIGITLLHEVGHLLGLDEEDLWERGLE